MPWNGPDQWMPNRKRAPKPIGLPPDAGDVFLAVELATSSTTSPRPTSTQIKALSTRFPVPPSLLHREERYCRREVSRNQLRKRLDEPVRAGNRTLTLKSMPGRVAKDALKYSS